MYTLVSSFSSSPFKIKGDVTLRPGIKIPLFCFLDILLGYDYWRTFTTGR